jgi:tetratricopeptide (TPR) repeat protein
MVIKLSTLFARVRQFAPFVLILISVVVAVTAYLQALHYPFASDDGAYIAENTKLAGLHLGELWRLFTEPYNDFSEFLPLRDLSYWLDITLFGRNSAEFRLHNIILYLLCLPLVYATTLSLWKYFRKTDVTSAPWAAATVTAMFALHPSLVESVVWISGRKYVLSNLFAMLALWLAVSAKREHGLSLPHAAAALLAFVGVMLSKASYVALAPVIALIWMMFLRNIPAPDRRRLQLLWPLSILVLAVLLILVFIASSVGREPVYFGIESVTRTLAVLGWLVRLAVTPESRHFFYPVFEDTYFSVMVGLGVAVLVAATFSVVMILRKRQSLEGFAIVAFLLICMPYIQLIPYSPPSLVSDRFLTFAAWLAVLLIVALAWRLNPMPRIALLLVIALAWSFQTIERPRDWRGETLLDTDLSAYPGHYHPAFHKIRNLLALGMYNDAIRTANSITNAEFRNLMIRMIQATYAVNSATTGKPDEALVLLQNFEIALNHLPAQIMWNSPMQYVRDECKFILALKVARLAEQFPDNALVRYKAGLWMLEDQNYNGAVTHLRAATESQHLLESVRGTAFKSFGVALLHSGHVAEAEVPLRAALEQSPPDFRAYCSLSKVYKQMGQIEDAAHTEAECLKLAPSEAKE